VVAELNIHTCKLSNCETEFDERFEPENSVCPEISVVGKNEEETSLLTLFSRFVGRT